jgi:integrase
LSLTEAQIRALKPKGSRYLVTDGGGLSLDVLPSGRLSWLYRYRLNGAYEKVVLGPYPDLTLKAAREKRNELATKVAKGVSPAAEMKALRSGTSSEMTVRAFGTRYYRDQVAGEHKRPEQTLRYLENEIFPAFGDKRLRDVTAEDVQELVYRKRDHGRQASAMRLRQIIKSVWDYAIEKRLVDKNPTSLVATRYIGKSRQRSRTLSPAEIRLYLGVVYRSNMRRQFKLALHVLLLTLVRKSELLLARWEHLDFEKAEWAIPAVHSKNARPHVVYMSRQVIDLFRELKRLAGHSPLALPGRSSIQRPFAANALNHALEGLTFDMDPVTIHDLRRTGSTLLHEQGFPSDVIEKALNHTIGGVRGTYNRAEFADQRRHMLQAWGDYIEGIFRDSGLNAETMGR